MVKYVSKDIICAKMMLCNFRSPDMTVSDFINDELPAEDVQPVIETEDLATATEQFICKNCGIRIENFDKIILEEDNNGYINKLFCEYIFKFCPECGAKVESCIKIPKRDKPLYTMDEICKMNGVEFNPSFVNEEG